MQMKVLVIFIGATQFFGTSVAHSQTIPVQVNQLDNKPVETSIAINPKNPDNIIGTLAPFEDKPYITADQGKSPHRGNLYIAWTQFAKCGSRAPHDSSFILFSRSTDGGRIFSPPVRVSGLAGDCVDSDSTVEGAVPSVGPNGEVYLAWGSRVGIVFYDRRDHAGDSTMVYLARSTDGGATFKNMPLTSAPFVPMATEFFGDYLGIGAYGGRIAPLWMQFFGTRIGIACSVIDSGK